MNYLISGIALINGLKLSGGGITCTAKRKKNNQIQIKIKKHTNAMRKLQLILFLLLLSVSMLPNEVNTPNTVIYSLFIPIALFMLALRYVPNLRILNYHGAEHKVVVAYRKKQPLTLETVRPISRVTNVCGTMFVTPIVFYVFLLSTVTLITDNMWIHGLLTIVALFSLGHYFFLRGEEKTYVNFKRLFPFLKKYLKKPTYQLKTNALYRVFNRMGYFLQEHFTTREPSDDELKVALLCMHRLLSEHK